MAIKVFIYSQKIPLAEMNLVFSLSLISSSEELVFCFDDSQRECKLILTVENKPECFSERLVLVLVLILVLVLVFVLVLVLVLVIVFLHCDLGLGLELGPNTLTWD